MNEMENVVQECKEGVNSVMNCSIKGIELLGESTGMLIKEINTLKGIVIGLGAITVCGFTYFAIKEQRRNKKTANPDNTEVTDKKE